MGFGWKFTLLAMKYPIMGSVILQVCSYICGEFMTTDFLPMTKVVFGASGVVCDIVSHDYGLLQLMSRLDVATGSDECRFEVGYCQYGGSMEDQQADCGWIKHLYQHRLDAPKKYFQEIGHLLCGCTHHLCHCIPHRKT